MIEKRNVTIWMMMAVCLFGVAEVDVYRSSKFNMYEGS